VSGLDVVDDGATGPGATAAFSFAAPPTLTGLPGCTFNSIEKMCRTMGPAVTVQLRYRPTGAGRHLGALRVMTQQGSTPLVHTLALHGEGTASVRVSDRLSIGTPLQTDVLMLVDATASFDSLRPTVARDIGELSRWATTSGVDARLAVVLVGEDATPQCPLCGSGRFAASDGGVRVLSPASSDFGAQVAQLLPLRGPGSGGDFDFEVGGALSAPHLFDPRANAGFLRENAALSVLTVWDFGALVPGGPAALPFLASVKGANRPELLTLNLVTAGGRAPPPDGCGLLPVPPDPLVVATHGAQANYCTAGMGPAFASVAPQVFGRRERAWLRGTPAPGGVVSVSLNGAPVPTSLWRYEALTNSVALDGVAVPTTPGASVDVTYDLACLLP
jgi:hypothetical protein